MFLLEVWYLVFILVTIGSCCIFHAIKIFTKMSIQLGRLISQILTDNFGEHVKIVGNDLFLHGLTTISLISKSTGLERIKVIESLRIMVKYGLVTFEPSLSELEVEYRIHNENILNVTRYPRYLTLIRARYSIEAEEIVEEILKEGMADTVEVMRNLISRREDDNDLGMYLVLQRDNFINLVKAGYVKAAPKPILAMDGSTAPILPTFAKSPLHLLPEINIRSLLEKTTEEVKDKSYWVINYNRFHRDFLDNLLITAVNRRIDDCAGELMKVLLKEMYLRTDSWVAYSNPIPFVELKESCKQSAAKFPLLLQYLDQYLKVIEENSSSFVSKSGDASGGQYRVNLKTSLNLLTWNIIENTVLEKLGSRAARIFRLIKSRKYIEEDDIQKHAMLPAKEAKQCTYKLMEENFVDIQVLRKATTGSSGPSKAVYLYYINLYQVAGMLLEMSYKALYNCMKRKECEKLDNSRILEKQQRVEAIIAGMRKIEGQEENIHDMELTVTPPEKELLLKVHNIIKKFDVAETQLDDTIFILQLYFLFESKS